MSQGGRKNFFGPAGRILMGASTVVMLATWSAPSADADSASARDMVRAARSQVAPSATGSDLARHATHAIHLQDRLFSAALSNTCEAQFVAPAFAPVFVPDCQNAQSDPAASTHQHSAP